MKHRNQNTNRDYCQNGHEFTPENTYINPKSQKRMCRICSTLRHQITEKNRKRTPEDRRIYRLKNIDRFLELERRQYKENPEKKKEASRRSQHKSYAENPERMLERNRQWRARNPEKRAAARHKRRAIEGNFTAQQWKELKTQYGNKCLGCGRTADELVRFGLKLTPDHVLPIALGGSGDVSNIQPLCFGKSGCNNRKSNKYIDFRNANLKVMPNASE
jgi:hypothetical protein